jgi:D-glycero-D-manno-heptose 1,7-bisphosphate phosphatase
MRHPGHKNAMNKAVFIDKDGTLVENIPYNIDPVKVCIYKDVPEALRMLNAKGFKIVVVSNQPGIALGHFKKRDFEKFIHFFYKRFEEQGIKLDGFYYCPHHPDGKVAKYSKECKCRKPKSGMILQAAEDLNIDISKSWMVGDILNDVESGKNAGCNTVLIDNGNETEWVLNGQRKPLYTFKKVISAAKMIIRYEKMQKGRKKRGDLYEGRFKKFNREF